MRVVFTEDSRKTFFDSVKSKSGGYNVAGEMVGISGKTLKDWRGGKTLPKYEIVEMLSSLYKIEIPNIVESREEWWSGRVNGSKAAKARAVLYGSPGTCKGRIKGGVISQKRRRENPDYYKNLGCIVRNKFKIPVKSPDLAEFIGIVLGDGSLSKKQCHISLHISDDKEYSEYVKKLINKLFDFEPSVLLIEKSSVRVVLISGVGFTEILERFGLRMGNKVKSQIDIPGWIKRDSNFYIACMRGLFDTDGGSFFHKHKVGVRNYVNFGLTFTSASLPMLDSFSKELSKLKIKHSRSGICLFMYSQKSIKRFFEIFKPNNLKHFERYQRYLSKAY